MIYDEDDTPKPKPTPPKSMTPTQIRDMTFVVGFALLELGLLGYDWRIAAIVSGTILTIAAVFGSVRGT